MEKNYKITIRSNKNKFLNSFSLVKKEGDKYYKARCCLVEVFQLMDYSSKVHLNDNNIINTKQDFVTYAELKKELNKGTHITKYAQPMEDKESFLDSCFESIYLSDTEKRGKDTVYLFWTFTAWNNRSGLEAYHRGIDRLRAGGGAYRTCGKSQRLGADDGNLWR